MPSWTTEETNFWISKLKKYVPFAQSYNNFKRDGFGFEVVYEELNTFIKIFECRIPSYYLMEIIVFEKIMNNE